MHTVTGELRKDTRNFSGNNNNGRWEGFAVDLTEVIKDRNGEKIYTNFQATFFAQSEKMAEYLRDVLVPGRVVTISAQKLKVKNFDGQDGQTRTTLELVDPRIDWSSFSVNNTNAGGGNSAGRNQSGWGAPQQNNKPKSQPQQNTGGQSGGDKPADFDDDVPF